MQSRITVEEFRASRVSGSPTAPAMAALLQKHDWEIQHPRTITVHHYEVGDQTAFIEERNVCGKAEFAYLFCHPRDSLAESRGAAEELLVEWINQNNGWDDESQEVA